jgi:hypothetical protein
VTEIKNVQHGRSQKRSQIKAITPDVFNSAPVPKHQLPATLPLRDSIRSQIKAITPDVFNSAPVPIPNTPDHPPLKKKRDQKERDHTPDHPPLEKRERILIHLQPTNSPTPKVPFPSFWCDFRGSLTVVVIFSSKLPLNFFYFLLFYFFSLFFLFLFLFFLFLLFAFLFFFFVLFIFIF